MKNNISVDNLYNKNKKNEMGLPTSSLLFKKRLFEKHLNDKDYQRKRDKQNLEHMIKSQQATLERVIKTITEYHEKKEVFD